MVSQQTIQPDDAVELRLRLPCETAEAVTSCCARLAVLPSQFIHLCIWEALHSLAEGIGPDDDFAVEQDCINSQIVLGVAGEVRLAPGTTCRVAMMFLEDAQEIEFMGETVEVQ